MKKKSLLIGFFIFCLYLLSGISLSLYAQESTTSTAPTQSSISEEEAAQLAQQLEKQELERQIHRKNLELDAIKKAIDANEEALSKVQGEKTTLQKELNSLKYQRDILTRQISSDEINLQKLDLEIRSLTFDIQDIEEGIGDRKKTIKTLFKEIQRQDETSLLNIVLKNESIGDLFNELKNLADLNNRLALDVENLKRLNNQYNGKLVELTDTQTQVERSSFNLKNRRVILSSQEQARQQLLKETKNQEAVYQQHLEDVMKRQQEIAAEVEALDAKLRGDIKEDTLPSEGKIFTSPIAGFTLTQGYGATSFAKSGYRGKWHNGIDLRASVGTPVLAVAIGTVEVVGDQDKYCPKGAYGKFVVINHPNNLMTMYTHLSRVVAQPGQSVKQGDIIGYAGSTGYATGPHLHFTVFAKETFRMGGSRTCGPMPQGGDINPLKYF